MTITEYISDLFQLQSVILHHTFLSLSFSLYFSVIIIFYNLNKNKQILKTEKNPCISYIKKSFTHTWKRPNANPSPTNGKNHWICAHKANSKKSHPPLENGL